MTLTTNLEAYYKFDSGTTDATANGKDLTAHGSPSTTTGKLSGAYAFNGTSQYLDVAWSDGSYSKTTPFSFSVWAKPANASPAAIAFVIGIGGYTDGFYIAQVSGSKRWTFGIAEQSITTGNDFTVGNWYHLVVTNDGAGTMTAYVNGISIGTASVTGAYTPKSLLRIGAEAKAVERYFEGSIDEVAVYSRSITADEVSQLFNSNRALAYPLTAPILYGARAYYKLDESSGDAADAVGENTLTNHSVTYSTGKINNGADFSSSKWFDKSTPIGLALRQSFSLSFWIKPNGNQTQHTNIYYVSGDSDGDAWYGADFSNGNNRKVVGKFYNGSTVSTVTLTADLTDNVWSHIGITYDYASGDFKIYLNGTLNNSTSVGANLGIAAYGTTKVVVGALKSLANYYINGSLDEIAVFDRALSSTEITALYNTNNGLQWPWVLGTAYTKTLTETVTMVDSVYRKTGKAIVETAVMVASIFKKTSKTLTDTTTMVDTVDTRLILTKVFTETVTLVDNIIKTANKAITETVTLVASISRSTTRYFTETVTLVASASTISVFTKTFTETVTLTATEIAKITARTLTETVSVTDTIITAKMYARAFTETVTTVAASALSTGKVITETVTLTITIGTIQGLGRLLKETISVGVRLRGTLNGLNMFYTNKYVDKAGTYVAKYAAKTGTYIKKYLDPK